GILRRICGRGYGWYLAIKIVKAVIAIPLFPIYIVGVPVLYCVLRVLLFCKYLIAKFPYELYAECVEYWGWNWFRNFSRRAYNKIYHAPKPIVYGDYADEEEEDEEEE